MFRLVGISKQSSNIHSKLTTPLLSNEIQYRNVSFKVKPAEDRIWRDYRKAVWKVRCECKVENRKMLAEKREKQRLYEEKFSFENLFGPAIKYAEEVNLRQKEKRETAKELKLKETARIEDELKSIRETEYFEKEKTIENILELESKKAEKYIKQTEIEQIIEKALNNPIIISFPFPQTKVLGDGKGTKNFDEKGEIILHETLPY